MGEFGVVRTVGVARTVVVGRTVGVVRVSGDTIGNRARDGLDADV